MIKKVIMLTFILTLFACISTVCHAAVDYSGIIESESNWIASLQQPTGSLVITRDHTWTDYSGEPGVPHYKIEPYFVNLGVIGMLENPATDNIAVAGNWMAWYLNHLNNPDYSGLYGSVYMYWADTSGSTEHSSGTYDSTDSYGATFMTLLRKYYETSGDSTFFTSNRTNIEKVADSIVATQQTDGLTYAMPSYQVKYAMDNAEVHEGLTDIEWIERNIYSDSAKADYYKGKKVSNFNGIESYLWDGLANNYRKYDGATSNWATFYPDATCQMFPVSCGVIGPRSLRADYLYMQLNTNHYEWPYLNTSEAEGFPWAVLAYEFRRSSAAVRLFTAMMYDIRKQKLPRP